MATLQDRRLDQNVMLRQIEDVLRYGRPEDPPAYTLVLGAGASFGAVPTAKQMLGLADKGVIHEDCIPAFLYQRQHGHKPTDEQLPQVVREFWDRFFAANAALLSDRVENGKKVSPIGRDPDGLPDGASIADAYKNLFDQRRTAGINTPSGAREYLRTITLRRKAESIALNGTHFFLASLLSLQRRMGETAEDGQPLYIGRRDFARTIFTTNFDPLLQVSLQLFQLLYYMTDRPELLAADGLYTDDHPALHLFYAHGSVHRPFLANTGDEITHLHSNARDLAAYLSRHGVIILGYAGWDDCLLRAMQATSSFANNLYWLVRNENSISPEVESFLCSKPNAFWVPIADGGEFMAALHTRLCPGMAFTELLHNPIPFVQRGLERVDLGNIEPTPFRTTDEMVPIGGPSGTVDVPPSPEQLRRQVVGLLRESAQHFVNLTATGSPDSQLKRIEHQADLAYAESKWSTAIDLYGRIIEHPNASEALRTRALLRRGYAHTQDGRRDDGILDYTRAIELPSAPANQVAKAFFNRGVCYWLQGEYEKAIADYSQVIDLPGASLKDVNKALINRGRTHHQQGKHAESLADYNRIIAQTDAAGDAVSRAYLGRAYHFLATGDNARARSDLEAALRIPEMPENLAENARHLLKLTDVPSPMNPPAAKKRTPSARRATGRKKQ